MNDPVAEARRHSGTIAWSRTGIIGLLQTVCGSAISAERPSEDERELVILEKIHVEDRRVERPPVIIDAGLKEARIFRRVIRRAQVDDAGARFSGRRAVQTGTFEHVHVAENRAGGIVGQERSAGAGRDRVTVEFGLRFIAQTANDEALVGVRCRVRDRHAR